MSKSVRCKSCWGKYQPVQPDGTLYFHACAPVRVDALGKPIEGAKRRDENIALDSEGKAAGIKAAGDGVEELGG